VFHSIADATGVRSKTAIHRAYVGVKEGSIWTSPKFIDYKFTLHNLGNTPASSVFVKYLVSRDDDNVEHVINEAVQVDIGPKDSRAYEGQLPNEAEGRSLRVVGLDVLR